MIPDIGIMIGAYVFTRMLAMARRPDDRVVQVFAMISLVVTVVVVVDLIMRGTTGLELRDFAQ